MNVVTKLKTAASAAKRTPTVHPAANFLTEPPSALQVYVTRKRNQEPQINDHTTQRILDGTRNRTTNEIKIVLYS
jgi:hypothetical protein